MRWSIREQLLAPFLFAVVLALVVATAVQGYLNAQWAGQRQEEHLGRLVATLTETGFPLTPEVLVKMKALSGAEFAVLDSGGQLHSSSLVASDEELLALRKVPPRPDVAAFTAGPRVTIGGKTYLAQRVPVVTRSGVTSVLSLVVLYPEDLWQAEGRRAIYPPLVGGSIAALAVMAMATWLARRFTKRIDRLRTHAANIACGEFQPLELTGRDDEIRDLTKALNQMAAQLARYEQQIRTSERLQTLGQLGGGIAHQLRNSVAGALLALELHQRECPLEPDCESLSVVHRQLDLMKTYLQRFLALGRGRSGPRGPVELGNLLTEVLELVRPLGQHTRVELLYHAPAAPITIEGDADMLRQLLVNLVMNALEAANQQTGVPGHVRVELEAVDGEAVLRVIDSGPGLSQPVQDHLFEPLVSDKPDGTGLGLSVAKQVADEHGGSITWGRQAGLTCFTVEFPLLDLEDAHGAVAGRG